MKKLGRGFDVFRAAEEEIERSLSQNVMNLSGALMHILREYCGFDSMTVQLHVGKNWEVYRLTKEERRCKMN